MSQDLAIYLKILLQDQSKSTIVTDVDKLVLTLQEKLNKITININSSSISQLTSQLSKLNEYTQNTSKSSTQNIQIIKELDGTVKKYSETIKANGEIIQKNTEIIDKNKIAKQQSTSSQVVNNINKETEAIKKLDSEYGKLIRTVKIKKADSDIPSRKDETYLNSQTGVKTTITSRPNKDNVYRTDNDFGAKRNADALKEQMKLARESAKLAKESNDYHQKYYKVQQKQFDENNKEYLRGVKLREKADIEAEKNRQKYIQDRIKGLQLEQKERQKSAQLDIKQLRQEKESKLGSYINSKNIQGKDFDEENKEYLRGIKLREREELNVQKIKQKNINDAVKLLQQEQSQREKSEQNYIKSLRQTAEQKLKAHQTSLKLIDQENSEFLRGIKLREKAEQDAEKLRQKYIQDRVKQLQQEQSQRQKLSQDNVKQLRKETEDRVRYYMQSQSVAKRNESVYQSQQNKLAPKFISTEGMTSQLKILPVNTTGLDQVKKKVEDLKIYIEGLSFRIKAGEIIPQETFRILNNFEAEVKRDIKLVNDLYAQKDKFNSGLNKMSQGKTGQFINQNELQNVKNMISNLDSLDKVKLNGVRSEIGKLGQDAAREYTKIKELNSLQTQKMSFRSDLKSLESGKSGQFVDQAELRYVKNLISTLNTLDKTSLQKIKDQIALLGQEAKKSHDEFKRMETVSKQLNTKSQNALNIGVKLNNLSPEQLAPLEKALARYKTLISEMQNKNLSGQIVSDKDIERLSRLENAIKRVYDMTRISSKDSRGFNFEQYPKMTNAVQGATNAQNYFNQSIIHGKKLMESSVQETDKYIKVTQRLRQGSEITNLTAYINKANGETHKFSETMKSLMTRTYDLGSAFKTAMEKFSIWMASGTIIFQSWHFFKDGISYVNEYNKALTQLSVVYMQTQTQVEKLGEKLHNLSIQMGVSTQEVAKGAVEFARQGLSQAESIKRMETAMKYAKISNLDFSTSARILTATVNSMGVSAEHASDIFSYLGDSTASGADEIGEAFQRMGGTIGSTDIEFEKAASWIAVISSKTRESAYTIGNSVKSIVARMQSLKEKGFDEEDGTQVNQVSKSLATIGVQLVDSEGQFRNFGTVMDEVGEKWKSLDNRHKAYISTTLAGTYQQARFLNLMENYGESVNLYKESLNQAGIANKKFDLIQQGTEAQLIKMKNTFEGVWLNAFSSEGIRNVISALTGLGNIISSLIKNVGLLPPVIVISTLALSALSNSMRVAFITNGMQIIGLLKQQIALLMQHSTAIARNASGATLATVAFNGLKLSITGVTTALLTAGRFFVGALIPIAIITAVSYAIVKLGEVVWDLFHKTEIAREEFNKLKDELKSVKEEITETENLLKTYELLSDGLAKTTEEKEKLANATQRLSELYPEAVIRYDSEGKAIENNIKLIKQYLEVKRQETIEKNKELKDRFIDTSDTDFDDLNENKNNISDKKKELNKFINLRDSNGIFKNFEYSDKDINENIIRIRKELRGFQDESNKTFETLSTGASALYSEFDNFDLGSSNLTLFIRDILNNSEELNKSGVEDIRGFIEQLGEAKVPNIFAEYNKALEEYKESPMLEKDYETLATKQASALSALTDVFKDLKLESSDTFKKLKEDFLSIPEPTKIEDQIVAFERYQEQLGSSFESTSKEVATLNDALDEYNESGKFSSKTIMQLLKDHPKLISSLTTENGIMKLNAEAVKDLSKEIEKEFKKTLELRNKDLKAQENALTKKLEGYNLEIKKLRELRKENEVSYAVELFQNAERKFGTQLSEAKQRYEDAKKSGNKNEEIKALQELDKINTVDKLNYLQEITESLNKLDDVTNSIKLNDATIGLDFDALSKEGKGKSDKDNPVTNLISKYTVEQEKIDALIEKSKAIQETLIPSSAEYRKETEEQIKLLKDKQNSIHDENLALTNLSKTTQLTDEQKNQSAKQYAKNSTEWYKIQKDIYEGSDKMMANTLSEFTSQLTELDNKQQFIEKTASKYSKSSQAYRDSIQLEIDIIKEKNNVLHQANEFIREQIASGKLTAQQAEEYRKQLQPNSNTYMSNIGEVDTKNLDILKSKYEELDIPIQQITDRLSMLQTVQSLYDEGSQQYISNTQQQIDVNKQLISALQAKHKAIEADLALAEKGTTTYEELSNILSDVIKAELDAVQKKKEFVKKIAEDTVKFMKEAYEKEKEIAIDAIEEQMEKEEERHDKIIKNLEDEMDEYEDSINKKKQLMDRLYNTEDYDSEMSKLNKEKLEIQKQIDYLGKNDSYEGKQLKAELQKELDAKNEEILNSQRDREKELRGENLDDLLDEYKDENEAKKELEDDKYDSTKKSLEKQKKTTERYYQDMIANEIKFNNLKEDLASGNVDSIISELQRLISFVNENEDSFGAGLGETLTSNLQNKIDQISKNIGSGNSGSGSNSNGSSQTPKAVITPSQYINENGTAIIKSRSLASILGEDVEWDQSTGRVKIGSKWFVPYRNDNGTTYLKLRETVESLGRTVKYDDITKNISIFHKGGVAGNSSNRIANLIDNVINKGKSTDELVSILQKGEPIISKFGVSNFVPTLQNIIGKFVPNISIPSFSPVGTNTGGNAGNVYNLNFNIANVSGDEKGAKYLYNEMINGVKKLGKNI